MSQRKNVFDSHSETEQIVWHRCPLMQGQGEIHMNLNLTRAQWQVSHSSLTHCNMTVHEISHDSTALVLWSTQSLTIFEDLNCRGQAQGQGLENWSMVLEDP